MGHAAKLLPPNARNWIRPAYQSVLAVRRHGLPGLLFYLDQLLRGGASVSPAVIVRGRFWPRLRSKGRCRIGVVEFTGYTRRSSILVHANGELLIEDGCYFNEGLTIAASRSISIGAGCLIASGVVMIDAGHAIGEGEPGRSAPIVVGRNVWIATNAIICAGVTIGDHSVIGAGSVVTRSIPDRVLAGGNPCHVIRPLVASDGWKRP